MSSVKRRKLTRTLALWARGNVLTDLPSSANEAGVLLRALKQGAAHSSPWSPRRLVDAQSRLIRSIHSGWRARVFSTTAPSCANPSSARHSAQRQECRPPIAFVVRWMVGENMRPPSIAQTCQLFPTPPVSFRGIVCTITSPTPHEGARYFR